MTAQEYEDLVKRADNIEARLTTLERKMEEDLARLIRFEADAKHFHSDVDGSYDEADLGIVAFA